MVMRRFSTPPIAEYYEPIDAPLEVDEYKSRIRSSVEEFGAEEFLDVSEILF